jgi:hypothetical protein
MIDPRHRPLNWKPQHDERSRAYGIADVADVAPADAERIPMMWTEGPVLDQGTEGACVGFGWTGALLAEPYAPSPQPVAAAGNLAALSYYNRAKVIDEFPGEDYSGTSVLAGAKVLAEDGKISEYRWCFSLDEVRYAVMTHGPVVLGIPWYESMYYTDAYGRVTISGPKVGGHCILLTGYHPLTSVGDTSAEYFRWRNSWGQTYGQDGSAWIKADDLAMLLSQDGEACVPTKIGPPVF